TAALAELPGDAANDLAQAMALVFSRMAGLSMQEYRNQLALQRRWEGPPTLPEFWDAVPGRRLTDNPETAFADEYKKLDLNEGRLTAISSTRDGWRLVVRKVPSTRRGNEFILFSTLSAEDVEMFGGGLGMKALIFHRWPPDWTSFSRDHPMMYVAEASTIIQTANGDRYPLHTVFIYDTSVNRWRLTKAFRQVTVRMARIGSLAF
ncbi:MAG: hypothetical protein NZM42_14755, partial [Gemmatales bacterium]|nr:hypothetical protein [Gemmatales bacterium]